MWLRKVTCIFIILAVMLSGFQISVGQENDLNQDDDTPITFRCAIDRIYNTNPLEEDKVSWKALGLVYEGATKYNLETGRLDPYIAVGSANESRKSSNITWEDCTVDNFGYSKKILWENQSKPEMIIFYDFENVYWHDDVQMSIRDIMFSFHAHATSQYSSLGHPLIDENNYSVDQWMSINIIWESDDSSKAALKFVLQKPYYSVFLHYLSLPILPYHIWGSKVGNQQEDGTRIWYDEDYDSSLNGTAWKPTLAKSWSNGQPIGSGPFKWGELEEDRLTLVTWRKHFYKSGYKYDDLASQPNIDEISFRFYNRRDQAISDLENNDIDYIGWTMDESDLNQFSRDPDLEFNYLKGAVMVDIIYNMRKKSFGYDLKWPASGIDLGKPLRRAIAHCVDNEAINSMTDFATEGENLGLFYNWNNISAPRYAFDPNEAVSILKKAGYLLENSSSPPGNGNWWLNPDGTTIGSSLDGTIELLISRQEQDQLMFQIGTMVTQELRKIGINIELVPLETGELWGRIFAGEFDMCVVAQDYETPIDILTVPVYYPHLYNKPPRIIQYTTTYDSSPSPKNGANNVDPDRARLRVFVSDPDGDPITVRFYNSITQKLIGTDIIYWDTEEGVQASVWWPDLKGHTDYSWYVIANDTFSKVQSQTWSFTTKTGTRGGSSVEVEGFPDIYLKRPENYFFSSFHSDNIYDGSNLYGYQNASFDRLIEDAMFSIDRDVEIQLARDAVTALAYDLPKEHLYYQYKYEVHRCDTFVNYIDDGSGSLLNPRSIARIRPPEKNQMNVRFTTIPLLTISDYMSLVRVRVTDQHGRSISDAQVTMGSSSGNLSAYSGLTDEQGYFTTVFTAPNVLPGTNSSNGTPVMVSILPVSKEGYLDAAGRESAILVYPENYVTLYVEANAETDVIEDRISTSQAGHTDIRVRVTDQHGNPVASASVIVELDGARMFLDPPNGTTDYQGYLKLKITATEVNETEECRITIRASRDGFLDGQQQITLTILPVDLTVYTITTQNNSWLIIMLVGSAAALAVAAFVLSKRKKRKKKS